MKTPASQTRSRSFNSMRTGAAIAMKRARPGTAFLRLVFWLVVVMGLTPARAQILIVDGNLNTGQGGVSAFAPTANGNVLPDMTLAGSSTGMSLNLPQGVAANATHLYVLCNNFVEPPFVLKYNRPTSGNATPVSKTYLASAAGPVAAANAVAIDGTNLYVLDNGTGIGAALGAVNVYPLSSLTSNLSGSPLAASRTVTGASTAFNRPSGLAVDGISIYVANPGAGNVLIFAVAASGNVAPTQTITGLALPMAVAVDATTLYALNNGTGTITSYTLSGIGGGGAVAPTTTIGSTSITSGVAYLSVDATRIYVGDAGDILGTPVPSVLVFPKATSSLTATPSATIAGNTALAGINGLVVVPPPITAPPAVTAGSGATTFTIGGGATAVDGALTLTAVPATLATATIQITGGWQTAEDVLAFTNNNATNFGNIAGVYNATLGLLRLVSDGATATTAQWQNALRAVTYNDTAGSPNTASRTLSIKVFDGEQSSTAATKTVSLSSAPSIVSVTPPANGTYKAGQALSFTVTFSSAVTVTGTPRLSLTIGSASRAAAYVSGSTTALTFTYTVALGDNDSDGIAVASPIDLNGGTIKAGLTSAALTFSPPTMPAVRVSTVPVLTASVGSTAYSAGDNTAVAATAVSVDGAMTLSDLSATTLASATIQITGSFQSSEDVLGFLNFGLFGNIVGTYDPVTGILALTSAGATATVAQWEAALHAVFYYSSAAVPNTASRTVSFTVKDAVQASNTVTKTVTVAAVNQTPVVIASSGSSSFTATLGAIKVDSAVTVSDGNNATLASATVSITGNFRSGEDVLAFTNDNSTTFGNIAVTSYNATTGVLTLTSAGSTATVAQWQAALRAVTYNATSSSPTTTDRTLSFVVNDGTTSSAVNAAANKTVTVARASVSTTVTVPAVSATYRTGNQTVTLTANVKSAGGTVNVSGGTVTFTLMNGVTPVGSSVTSSPVANGSATVSYSLPVGTIAETYAIQAAYNGAPGFDASSGTNDLTVRSTPTTITTSDISVAYSADTRSLTLTANVTSSTGDPVIAGSVDFVVVGLDGPYGGTSATARVIKGKATVSHPLLGGTKISSWRIRVIYGDDSGNFGNCTDDSHSLTVTAAPTMLSASGAFTVKTRVSTFVSSGLEAPESMAFDTAGNLYVANVTRSNISKITPDGKVSTFAGGADSSQVSSPDGLAFDAAGNLYVANAADSGAGISKVTKEGKESAFGPRASMGGGLAFDTAGNLYRANRDGNVIYKITPSGIASTFVSSGLSSPEGLAFDKARNLLYVVNQTRHTISKVTPDGAMSTFVSLGLLSDIGDLALDAAGNVYISNFYDGTISKVTPAGTLSTYVPHGSSQPWGLAVDAAGNLYFSDTNSNSIKKVAPVNLVALSATVSSTGGTVSTGTVTFTLVDSKNNTIGTPVTSDTVSAGTASVTYPIPGGVSSPPYTIQAVYTPAAAGSFSGSSDSSQKLAPTPVQAVQIFFGQFNTSAFATSFSGGSNRRAHVAPATSIAAVLNADGTTGKLVGYIGSISTGFAVNIAIAADNTFTGQTKALTSSTGTGQTLTFSGSIANGVMTGTVAELGLTFTANVDPDAGSSSAVAGLYQASGSGASTYSIVGTQGRIFVLALTPGGVAAGTGTLASDNTYTVLTSQGPSVAGSVNAANNTTTATVTLPNGGGAIGVSGVSAETPAVHRLVNLSSRGNLGSGEVLIDGFVVSGNGPKNVLVRAIGPTLAGFGVPSPLATPTLRILDRTGATVVSSSGWADDSALSAAFTQTGAFPLAAGTRDAAAIATLQPGVYSLLVTGGGLSGEVLTEIYDRDPTASPLQGNLANASARGSVNGNANVMIAGFVIDGNSPLKVLIRGVGPALSAYGVSGALANPVLTLRNTQQSVIAQNQAWGTPLTVTGGQTPATAIEIANAASVVGAFALTVGSNDTALLAVLPPGIYSAQLAGANNASGTALIEIYVVP